MFVANLAAHTFAHMSTMAAWVFQEQAAVGWDPISLWHQMGIPAKAVVIILFVMSGWSIGVMIDRAMALAGIPIWCQSEIGSQPTAACSWKNQAAIVDICV